MSFDDYDIVVVDSDEEFLAEAKSVFEGVVTTARTVADAQRLVEAGDLDLLVLGPSNAHEAALESFSLLLELDSDLPVVLATGTITAQLLRTALRFGLRDVIHHLSPQKRSTRFFGTPNAVRTAVRGCSC